MSLLFNWIACGIALVAVIYLIFREILKAEKKACGEI